MDLFDTLPAPAGRPGAASLAVRRRHGPRRRYLTDRDIARIEAMAAQVTETYQPPILDDLDAPIRVGACLPGQETFLGAHVVIPWRGRLILGWTLGRKARDRRRKGTSESGSPTLGPW